VRALPPPETRLLVATYNIHGCVGTDRHRDIGRIAAVLAELDADIVGLQEVDSRPSRSASAQAPELARRLDMELAEGPLLLEGDGHYGNALLSRWPLRIERRQRLPHRVGEARGFIHAAVAPPAGCQWHVLVTHLSLGASSRRRQLAAVADELSVTMPTPAVLLADLNEWYGWARGLAGLGRVATLLAAPPTFPSRRPMLRLDRIALRGCRATRPAWTHRTALSAVASDHLPLLAEITAEAPTEQRGHRQAGPTVWNPVAD
jgi:endonuclease/exonuclease/phosphatase family metal-dependent hydrolase